MNVKRNVTTSNANKKKTGNTTESQKTPRTKSATTSTNLTATPRIKSRTVTPRNILAKTQNTSKDKEKDRARSREKSITKESNSSLVTEMVKTPVSRNTICRSGGTVSNTVSNLTSSSTRTRTRILPDSLPSMLTTELNKDLALHGSAIRSTSKSRAGSSTRGTRTPATTPSEETRSKVPSLPRTLFATRTVDMKASRIDKTNSNQDKTMDMYATLPRMNRNKLAISKTNIDKVTRSRSGSRDISKITDKKIINGRESPFLHKSLPPYPRHRTMEKTRIYHETSAQTGLTGKDIEKALLGQPSIVTGPEVIEKLHRTCQTDDIWDNMQVLQNNLKRLNEERNTHKEENDKLKLQLVEVNRLLEEERADHAFARQELDKNAQRVLAMLGTPQSEHAGNYRINN